MADNKSEHSENWGRRMTDTPVAVRMERIEGEHRLLAAQVKQSVDALTNTLASLQSETRHVSTKISELAGLQGSNEFNKNAIDELKRSLVDMNTRLEQWFDDFDNRNERRWTAYEQDRNQWRRDHEADNEKDKLELHKEIRNVRETVIRALSWGAGAGALVTVVAVGFMWNLNYRFNDVTTDATKGIERIEATATRNRQLIDQMGVDHGRELADIKLYLARGGRIPEEPYIPQSQRKKNGNE